MNQAYSAPWRLVQVCLQVTEHVWQPMHLSRFITIAEGAVGDDGPPGGRIEQHRLPGRRRLVVRVEPQVRDGEELPGDELAVLFLEFDQERQIGELLDVLGEIRDLPSDEALGEDHMPHGHRQRAVGAWVRCSHSSANFVASA